MLKYKGEDVVHNAMGGFNLDGKFVYGNLAITPSAMIYYDKKVDDVTPLAHIAKVELVKGGPVFTIVLTTGGEKQYRTGNAKAWIGKLEEWIDRAAHPPETPVTPPGSTIKAPSMQPETLAAGPEPAGDGSLTFDTRMPVTTVQHAYTAPPRPVPVPSTTLPPPPAPQPAMASQPERSSSQPQPFVEVILAGLEPRSPAGKEFRLPVHEWAQVWAVVSAMIVMAPDNESISKDVAIQVLLPSTGFQVAGLDHRVAAQIIETALTQQQQKTIDIVAVTYGKIDFGIIYDDLRGLPSPPFDPERFIMNCNLFLEFAKDNLGFTVTIAKPAQVVKPIVAPAAASPVNASSPAKRDFQFCTQCGKQNTITARFCVRCGKPMKIVN